MMDLNATLIGQMITFAIFVWFTVKFVWPPLVKAMKERQKTIADGLAAAEKGHKELELAQRKALELVREAKLEASHIVEQSNKRSVQIVEEAKEQARVAGQRLIESAKDEIEKAKNHAREELREQLASLVVAGAEKILEQKIDSKAHDQLLQKLATEV